MSYNVFSEKKIRNAILNKIHPKVSKQGKHWKGYVYLDDVLITKVKIPNEHTRDFTGKKPGFLAQALRLTPDQYNEFVECDLTGTAYFKLLEKFK